MALVALYGASKFGFNIASTLKDNQRLGVGYVYGMELFTRRGFFPESRPTDDPFNSIVVEVFDIPEAALRTLDWDEGFPDIVSRKVVRVLLGDSLVSAYIYCTLDDTSIYPAIPEGDWAAYYEEKRANKGEKT